MYNPPYGKAPRYGGEYYYEERRRGGNCCIRCICCFYCFLFFLILIAASIVLYIYIYYDPKMPSYKFQSLDVKEFGFHPDSSVTANLIISMKADNPNKRIGFIYGENSSVNVTYSDSIICSGKVPAFYQGHKNITIMQIELKGKTQFGTGLLEALKDNDKRGRIPLKVMVKVPVRIVLENTKLREVIVLVNSTLVVNNLKPGQKPDIEDSTPTFKVKF